jgi:hypothetical protein
MTLLGVREGSFEGSSLVLVGAAHVITDIKFMKGQNPKAFPAFKYMGENPSIAVSSKFIRSCIFFFVV